MRVIPSFTNLGILCKRNEAINGTLHSTFPWPSQVGSQFLFIYFLTESTKDWYNVSYAEYHSCHTWVVAKLRVIPFDFDLIQGMLGLVGHKGQSLLGRCPATWLFLFFLSDNSISFSLTGRVWVMPLVVGEVHPLFSGFYNWVFVVLKPLGGWRHEVDLTHLKFVSLISVTIETMDSWENSLG